MKFWIPKFQAWMSLDELTYRKMQAEQQTVLVRETPASSVEAQRDRIARYVQAHN